MIAILGCRTKEQAEFVSYSLDAIVGRRGTYIDAGPPTLYD
jgi:hypothetical protein